MLKGILSISGQNGLFKIVSQGKNSIIVESLIDGSRKAAHATSKISALEDISMYTQEDDIKLSAVMANIFNVTNGQQCLDPKKASADEMKAFMDKVLPTWDKDRIYTSDLKKLFGWYNILVSKGVITAESIAESQKEEAEEAAEEEAK